MAFTAQGHGATVIEFMDSFLPRKSVPGRRFAYISLATMAALAPLLAGCEADQAEGGQAPAIVLSDVTLRHYTKDGVERIGRAREVVFSRDSGQLEARELSADVPPTDEMGRGGTHLEAARGEADIKGQTARLEGGVRVRTGEGDEGRTDALTWEQGNDIVLGDSPVRVVGPGYDLEADSFRFRVHDQKLELGGGVKFHSLLEADGGPEKAEVAP